MKKLSRLFSIGQQKEQQAKHWLINKQVKILAENFHCKGGEIDLIGLEQESLVFFEVKYRKQTDYGDPAETVTYRKQQHIILCAQQFLLQNPQFQDYAMRFDVITFTAQQQTPTWIKDAFQTY